MHTNEFIDRLAMSLADYLTTSEFSIPDLNVDPAGLVFVRLVKEIATIEIDLPGIRELLKWLVPRCRFELTLELLRVEFIPVKALVSLIRPVLDVPLKLFEITEAEADTLVSGFKAIVDRVLELTSDHLELWTYSMSPTSTPSSFPSSYPKYVKILHLIKSRKLLVNMYIDSPFLQSQSRQMMHLKCFHPSMPISWQLKC